MHSAAPLSYRVPPVFAWLIVAAALCSPPTLHADVSPPVENKSTFVLYFENDTFAGTDKHYTNAVKLSWISKDLEKIGPERGLPGWARWVVEKTPGVDRKDFLHNLALSLGQNIYTPEDITVEALIEDDRPYAGWTYLAGALHSKNFDMLNTLELSLGIVGPSSLAEQSQELFHEWLNDEEPQGWDNQLSDEPGLILTWQRFWRVLRKSVGNRFAWDVIPHAGVTLGNVLTYANLGGEIRFGYNLAADFGTSLIRPGGGTSAPVGLRDPRIGDGADFGVTVFAGVDGRALARNIFLDGNTWRDSHSVDKKPFVADIASGVSVVYKRVKLTYTHVYRTKEFDGQDDGQFFGSISLAVTF